MFSGLGHWVRLRRSLYREAQKAKERPYDVLLAQHRHLKAHPNCSACGGGAHVQAHHILPYHLHPDLGTAPSNMMTLCMGAFECHLRLGHGSNFRGWNPNVVLDVNSARSSLSLGLLKYRMVRSEIDDRARAACMLK